MSILHISIHITAYHYCVLIKQQCTYLSRCSTYSILYSHPIYFCDTLDSPSVTQQMSNDKQVNYWTMNVGKTLWIRCQKNLSTICISIFFTYGTSVIFHVTFFGKCAWNMHTALHSKAFHTNYLTTYEYVHKLLR